MHRVVTVNTSDDENVIMPATKDVYVDQDDVKTVNLAVRKAVLGLTPLERCVAEGAFVEGKSILRLAQENRTTVHGVKTAAARARVKLRTKLQQYA